MKKIYLLMLLSLLILSVKAQNPNPDQNKIYNFDEVMRIDITMADTHKVELLDDIDVSSDVYLPASIVIKSSKIDSILPSVGVRLRGNTSRGNDKKSIKISFTAFDGEKFYNHKKFNLKAEVNDPSLLREYISLNIYRNYGVPAARAHYVQLHINGEYMGVYLNVEQIDDEFVDRRFDDNEAGNLYKCLYPANLADYNEVYNNDIYILKTNKDKNDRTLLNNFMRELNTSSDADFVTNLDPLVNIDNYLKQLAVEATIGHWDGYTRNSNNFYLYEDSISNKVQFIPYDLDNTWGVDWGFVDYENETATNWVSSSWNDCPLSSRVLDVDEYYESYCRHVVTIADSLFNEENVYPIFDSVQKMLGSLIENDTYYSLDRGYTSSDFQNAVDVAWGSHVWYSLKGYLSTRRTQILSNLSEYEPYGGDDNQNPSGITSVSSNQLNIFPNPVSNGYFSVNSDESLDGLAVKVYDQTGRSIPIQISETGQGNYRVEFTQTPYPGIYFLRVGSYSQQLLVQ